MDDPAALDVNHFERRHFLERAELVARLDANGSAPRLDGLKGREQEVGRTDLLPANLDLRREEVVGVQPGGGILQV